MVQNISKSSLIATHGANNMECRGLENDGQSMVEYVLLLVLIAIICITALTMLGRQTENLIPTANDLEARQK